MEVPTSIVTSRPADPAGIRRAYEAYPLTDFDILAVAHDMPAACTVTARLHRASGPPATVSPMDPRGRQGLSQAGPMVGRVAIVHMGALASLRTREQLRLLEEPRGAG
ncbi:hypothetical protein WDA79_07600 [Streptomyces sp. A475]|uniref:hypothetical protein n=1 Tax=Streptomyces sp. A475 TaxID=3131976 RepID=UPI0030C958D8